MATARIPVKPDVLVWARSSAGYSVSAAAKKLAVTEDALSAWEAGTVAPTIVQLRKMAKRYGRPLAVLLLPRPPKDFAVPKDFRRIELEASTLSPELRKALRRAHTQREVFLELADIAPGVLAASDPPPGISPDENEESAGLKLREYLDVSLVAQRSFKDRYAALNGWVAATESRGIIVIQTDRVNVDEVRGFSISDWPYPVVALNGGDAPHAKIFTLLHELAHLASNLGGLCDLYDRRRDIERRCNEIAAAALLPRDALPSTPADGDWSLDRLEELVAEFNVSTQAIMLRLVSLQRATWMDYWSMVEKSQEQRAQQSEDGAASTETKFADYYRIKTRNLGRRYIRSILEAYDTRELSATDVIDYLDIKFSQINKLREVAGA